MVTTVWRRIPARNPRQDKDSLYTAALEMDIYHLAQSLLTGNCVRCQPPTLYFQVAWPVGRSPLAQALARPRRSLVVLLGGAVPDWAARQGRGAGRRSRPLGRELL
jgi:hypothetical protein